jgi:hypothetical protein
VNATIIGAATRDIKLQWLVTGEISDEPLDDAWRRRFVPRSAGRITVHAAASDRDAGVTVEKRITITVAPAYPSAAELARRRRRDEIIQTAVAGALIAATGFMIFQGSWFGSGEDWLAALLWGYTVDIGVAKVLEVASPIAAKPLPLRA